MISKSDAGVRMLLSVERQVELVQEFERRGLSCPRFVAMGGLKYWTFATWRRIGYHPACAGSWFSGGEPIRPRRPHTPSPINVQAQLDPLPQKQFLFDQPA
jgi:hypothetical protein